jgi:hypothetical protein
MRLYNCRRCGCQVSICRDCDHGNVYCAGECARLRRSESLRRAGACYQSGLSGARRHAARQRAWRERRAKKVTHHGFPGVPAAVKLAPSLTPPQEPENAEVLPVARPAPVVCAPGAAAAGECSAAGADNGAPRGHQAGRPLPPAGGRCDFCHRRLLPFARHGSLRTRR